MQIKKSKAAVLAKSREPLIIDEIEFQKRLGSFWLRSSMDRFQQPIDGLPGTPRRKNQSRPDAAPT